MLNSLLADLCFAAPLFIRIGFMVGDCVNLAATNRTSNLDNFHFFVVPWIHSTIRCCQQQQASIRSSDIFHLFGIDGVVNT